MFAAQLHGCTPTVPDSCDSLGLSRTWDRTARVGLDLRAIYRLRSSIRPSNHTDEPTNVSPDTPGQAIPPVKPLVWAAPRNRVRRRL